MTRIWVCSDHHFEHANILKFTGADGQLIRPNFNHIWEMDQHMVERHNAVVKPQDHVYMLGDVAIKKGGLNYVKLLNGHKRLVRGNHDIFKTRQYIEVGFEEIYGVRVFQNALPRPVILSHIPLHPDCLKGRNWLNIHGHLHSNVVRRLDGEPDPNYMSVCMEQLNDYTPHLLME